MFTYEKNNQYNYKTIVQKSYSKNYLKIYFWQGVSLLLNFLTLFIVIPYLTSDKTTYGVYTICISFSIFLTYADFGFVGAGKKYATEYFAKGDRENEIKTIGFTSFVLLIFLLLFSSFFIIVSFYPTFFIKDIKGNGQEYIASTLLLILGLFTIVTLLQRLSQMIFGIRLDDFICQRINIVGSLLKIISVLWFFNNGKYNIIGYFLFTQIVNLATSSFALIIARKRYQYDFKLLINSLKFNKKVFNKTKKLAFASLFITFSWILYYELDSVIIGKFLGVNQVAVYAIGLTVLTFFRSIFGILFSPFNTRFNHFIGLDDEEGLKSFLKHIVVMLAPVVVFPILTMAMLLKPLILCWVGENYSNSVYISQLLIMCYLFAFITYPISNLLVAKERLKELYYLAALLPFIFWIGIILSVSHIGVLAFAIFKFTAFTISMVFYYRIMMRYMGMSFWKSILIIFKPMFLSLLFLIISAILIKNYLPFEKNKINLLIVMLSIGVIVVGAFIIHYLSSNNWRSQVLKTLKR
ncbi:polysaccharide biosynthesis protein [Tenacibaculum sp. Bg11-29]|uniref:lipopolysaccharide biosynthesis protein n=1 Tax=Tenacibaculum sp. Bg11-29 TaxID=2058306 RepID=UPI000C329431|nr:polysaccharide biosynthesis protein [Tenacibaculum sp. Bg11-29]PKH50424.1 polysaccharide biosynthesis protein [Tenacibaculum sp. Bg11-29]